MKKLELKQIAPYLPYRVELYDVCKQRQITTMNLNNFEFSVRNLYYDDSSIKLILIPLSDLHKDKETFNKIAIYKKAGVEYLIEQVMLGLVEVIVFNMLLEKHYDLFGLIEKGLAVDKNTLTKF